MTTARRSAQALRRTPYHEAGHALAGQWLTTWIELVKTNVRPATHVQYNGIIQNHVLNADTYCSARQRSQNWLRPADVPREAPSIAGLSLAALD